MSSLYLTQWKLFDWVYESQPPTPTPTHTSLVATDDNKLMQHFQLCWLHFGATMCLAHWERYWRVGPTYWMHPWVSEHWVRGGHVILPKCLYFRHFRPLSVTCPRSRTLLVLGPSRHHLSQLPSWHLNVCPWQSALWVATHHPCLASQIFSGEDKAKAQSKVSTLS